MGISIREVHYAANIEDLRASSIVCKWWGFGSLGAAGLPLWALPTSAPSEWNQDNLGMNKIWCCYWIHCWHWESLQRISLFDIPSPLGKRRSVTGKISPPPLICLGTVKLEEGIWPGDLTLCSFFCLERTVHLASHKMPIIETTNGQHSGVDWISFKLYWLFQLIFITSCGNAIT